MNAPAPRYRDTATGAALPAPARRPARFTLSPGQWARAILLALALDGLIWAVLVALP